MGRNSWVWQQDGASIHISKATTAFLRQRNVTTVDWPAKSPDLNLIENVWAVLANEVYRDGQFLSKANLESRIKNCCDNFSPDTIKNLYPSMKTRLEQVVAKKGGQIDY